MRVHTRKDFDYIVIRGRGAFSPAAYACIITQSTAFEGIRSIYHIETFYGENGTKVRAEASRYGSAIKRGLRGVRGFREQYLPSHFPAKGLPPREDQVEIPG